MRTFRFISAFMLALVLWGCKSTQKLTEDVETSVKQTETSATITVENSVRNMLENEELEIEQIVTEWSEPDSLGKQHPLKSTATKAKRKKNGSENSVQTKTEQCSKAVQSDTHSKSKKKRKTTVKDAGYDTLKTYGILGLFILSALGYVYIKKQV